MKKKLLDVLNSLFFLLRVIQFLCYTEIEKSDAINFFVIFPFFYYLIDNLFVYPFKFYCFKFTMNDLFFR